MQCSTLCKRIESMLQQGEDFDSDSIALIMKGNQNNARYKEQSKKLIGTNGQAMAALISQQHHLVRKWLTVILHSV